MLTQYWPQHCYKEVRILVKMKISKKKKIVLSSEVVTDKTLSKKCSEKPYVNKKWKVLKTLLE